MIKPRALCLMPNNRKGVLEVMAMREILLANSWQVKFLSHDDKHYHEYGVVIIPNSFGTNINTSYYVGPPSAPPQDNVIEYWRLNLLHYYINKGIPIFGTGASGAMIFAEVFASKGARITLTEDGVWPVGHIHHCEWDERCETFFSLDKKIAGTLKPFSEDTVCLLERFFKEGGVLQPNTSNKPKVLYDFNPFGDGP